MRDGVCENEEEEELEEYLKTANWQLGNRRVRCCLMSDTQEREGKGVETHLQRMDCLHNFSSLCPSDNHLPFLFTPPPATPRYTPFPLL